MAGSDLTVKVDANTSGYEAGIERAQKATYRYETALTALDANLRALEKQLDDDINAALDRQHDAMERTGQAAFVFGAALAAGLGLAVNEAIRWESAWAGVTKTVDGSDSQMAALEDDLRRLATVLPATHQEIAAVAEAAGQLGVAREDITAFTKTMMDLGETTDLTADAAATSIAQMMNIMQSAPEDVDRVGAALVALGNDGASTESQILGMAQRIAGAGAQIGMSESDILAVANALASVGIEVEAGGSAISSVMKKIQLDISTNAARLQDWAAVAGMSAEEFKALWQEDAAAGLNAFVQGLGNVSASGGDAIKTLADLEIKQIRESDALLRLAGSGDLLTESLELGNRAWEENSALVDEAAKRYETTEAKVAIARNQLVDTAIDIGEVLLPAVGAIVDVTGDMLRAWQDLPGPLRTGAVLITAPAAAVGLFGGAALIAIPKIAAFQAAVAGLEAGALRRAGTSLIGFGRFLTGPWGLGLAAAAIGVGIFAAKHGDAAREVDALTATLDAQTGALTANSVEWATKRLVDAEGIDAAKELGLSLGVVVDAMLGEAAAVQSVTAAYRDNYEELLARKAAGEEISDSAIDQAQASQVLADIIGTTNDVVAEGTARWQVDAEVKESSAVATKQAGEAQQGTTAAWEDGAAAAGELTEEVKTLGEQLEELSAGYLNNRAAGRAVRDGLRQIEDAVKAYRKEHGDLEGAFRGGTESGDEFAAMLDDLAGDYQQQIRATQELTGSERKTMQAYRESRAALIDVADQLGMTRDEARRYATEVLGTPKMVKTMFDAQTEGAMADVRALELAMQEAARNRQARIDIAVRYQTYGMPSRGGLQEANGGIVQAYADGGFSEHGTYVHRVPQLRQGGGTVQWNEPETGWEAYISGKPGMEARNREVWSEAGRRLGFGSGGAGARVVERIVEKLPDTLILDASELGRLVIDTTDGQIREYRHNDSKRAEAETYGGYSDHD